MLEACSLFFFLRFPSPPAPSLFPYTTLFRSGRLLRPGRVHQPEVVADGVLDQHGTGLLEHPVRNDFRLVDTRSEEHTSELQSLRHLVCRLLLEKKKKRG